MDEHEIETVEETAVTTDTGKEEERSKYPTQALLVIRAVVGAYVFYMAYGIVTSGKEISTLMWAAVALFFTAGAALVILSIKHFICGEYEGGKKDI